MKNERKYAIFMLGVLIFFFVISFFPRDYSYIEMRENAKKPKLNKENLFDGTFGKEYESYLIDGFPLKLELYKLHSYYRYLLGNKEIKNVFITTDRLYQKPLKNPKLLKLIKDKSIKKKTILLPYKMYFGVLPASIYLMGVEEYKKSYDDIKKYADIDLSTVLQLDDYHVSDHHLNKNGIIKVLDLLKFDDYKVDETIKFVGGLSRKTGIYIKDEFSPIVANDTDYKNMKFTYGSNENKKGDDLVYRYDILNAKTLDKYLFFLGGNYGKIEIKNDNREKNLLIIKDSFANPFIPFFSKGYKNTVVIDLRFFRENIETYIKSADDIIIFGAL